MTLDGPDSAEAPTPRRGRRLGRVAALVMLLGLGVGITVMLGTGFGRDPAVVRSALINRPAPALAGQTLDGGRVNIRDHQGKIVLVNVWASWCAACEREHPVLITAQRRLGPRGLQIIGINTSDTRAEANRFLDARGGATYPSVFDPHAEIAVEWGTFALPETYVVDRDGTIREKAVGAVTEQWIEAHVVPLLDG